MRLRIQSWTRDERQRCLAKHIHLISYHPRPHPHQANVLVSLFRHPAFYLSTKISSSLSTLPSPNFSSKSSPYETGLKNPIHASTCYPTRSGPLRINAHYKHG